MASNWCNTTWGDEISLEYGKALRGYKDSKGAYRVNVRRRYGERRTSFERLS